MKRFFYFYLIAALTIGQALAASPQQDSSQTPSETSQPETEQQVENEGDALAGQSQNNTTGEASSEGEDLPLVERINQLAEKADFTFIVSIVAALAAIASGGIAWAAYRATKRMSYVQSRAYPGIGAVNYTFTRLDEAAGSFNSGSSGASIGIHCELKNYGQTPAYNFKASISLEIVEYPGLEEIEPADLPDSGYTLNPGNVPGIGNVLRLSGERVDMLVNQTSRLFAVVKLKYMDYDGNEHWEKVHFVLPSIGAGSRFLKSHGGVTATMKYHKSESSND